MVYIWFILGCLPLVYTITFDQQPRVKEVAADYLGQRVDTVSLGLYCWTFFIGSLAGLLTKEIKMENTRPRKRVLTNNNNSVSE